jgi:hypothetical protein
MLDAYLRRFDIEHTLTRLRLPVGSYNTFGCLENGLRDLLRSPACGGRFDDFLQ